jgi:hypothetical protein
LNLFDRGESLAKQNLFYGHCCCEIPRFGHLLMSDESLDTAEI